MSSKGCSSTRSRFLELEDGSLSAESAAPVRAHLAACGACRHAWERWQADGARLREALSPVPVPRDLAGAAVARIRGRAAAARALPGRGRVLRWGVAAAAAAVLLAFGAWMLLGRRYEPIGQVAAVQGQVLARQRGARTASPIQPGAIVYSGDELVAGVASRAAVALYDRSRLAMSESTDVRLHCVADSSDADCGFELPHVCLQQGEVECELNSLRYFRAVGTPLGTAIVQGTKFRMKYVAGERVLLEVLEGEVLFSSPGGQISVTPGGVWAIEGPKGVPQRLPDGSWK